VGARLGFEPPRSGLLIGIVVIVAAYATATELAKAWFYRRRTT
jgi:hypothetical protein